MFCFSFCKGLCGKWYGSINFCPFPSSGATGKFSHSQYLGQVPRSSHRKPSREAPKVSTNLQLKLNTPQSSSVPRTFICTHTCWSSWGGVAKKLVGKIPKSVNKLHRQLSQYFLKFWEYKVCKYPKRLNSNYITLTHFHNELHNYIISCGSSLISSVSLLFTMCQHIGHSIVFV